MRHRTKTIRTKKTFKRTDVPADQSKELSEDLRDVSDESDEDCEDSDFEEEEILEGEILNFEVPTESYKMVLCVNTSLKKMDKGKAMAQCGHATLGAYRLCEKYAPSNLRHWYMFGQAKIAVKCSEEEMLQVSEQARKMGIVSYTVMDAGRTQIPAGSKTVCAIGPAPQSMLDEISGKFKLM
jgi:peptidyl-tRNA hydrolase, PTH2 family